MAVEMESFEITDWDLQNEFNRPRTKRPSKKQQIYGIWADEDSDDDDERPSFGSEGKGKKDFTAPINFISGGFKQPAEKKDQKPADEDDKNSSDEELPVRTTRRDFQRNSLRFSNRSSGGRNQRFAGVRGEATATDQTFGSWEKHTRGIGQKLLLQMGYQPGKGLGKDQQGITTPIQAKKREGKGALGLYGPEHLKNPKLATTIDLGHSEDDDDEAPANRDDHLKRNRENLHHWKKKQGDDVKVKYIYKTVDEVKSEGAYKKLHGDFNSLSSVKVIDMTGPEQRVLSGYHQIHQQHSKPSDSESQEQEGPIGRGHHFALPELEHNLALLVDVTEQAILRNDRQLRTSKDRIVSLQHEDERLSQLLEQEKKQIDQLKDILQLIDDLEKSESVSGFTLTEAATVFKKFQEDYYEEYRMYELSDLAVTIVFPLVKNYLESWNPLSNSFFGLDVFKMWKDILETEEGSRTSSNSLNTMMMMMATEETFDPYHQLVWDVWMPFIRKSVLCWNVRQPDQLIEPLENWLPLLPSWIMENILTQLVYPCLEREVTEWNPVLDTMPIHAWLHPWLPLMGDRLENLYPPIRHKLAVALTNWHPGDCSAKLILEPWRNVFSKGTMEAFVVTNILPKLILAMQGFIINPHQQHLDVWHWVMTWEDLLPLPSLVSLLEKSFFPKWLQVLCGWLSHSPNYEEVTKWYMGWKSMFSPSLHTHPIVRDQFKKALDIMNQAVSSPQVPLGYQLGAREGLSYLSTMEQQQRQQQQESANQQANLKSKWGYEAVSQAIRGHATNAASLSISFKELIEKKAEELGLLFAPAPNRYQEGKQVYRFGNSTMYLDRGVIFVFNGKVWVPTSLQSLLDMAI